MPRVVASAPKVLVSEWMDGIPLARIIAGGDRPQRDRAGYLLALLHFSAPQRAGLLHADPHPGNFRLLPDGRLGVIDFGAVARLPGGLPEPIGRLVRLALEGDADGGARRAARRGLRAARIWPWTPRGCCATCGRCWSRWRGRRSSSPGSGCGPRRPGSRDPRNEAAQMGRQLNLPPSYLLIHRVTIGSIGVLCQLDAEAPYRGIVERWQPGFAK